MPPPATRLNIATPALPNATPFPSLALRNGSLASSNHPSSRLLKTPANIVLTSEKSSTYPRGYASGVFFGCGLVGGRFEQPARSDVVATVWTCCAIAHEKICVVG